jgi:hypothetical protein
MLRNEFICLFVDEVSTRKKKDDGNFADHVRVTRVDAVSRIFLPGGY